MAVELDHPFTTTRAIDDSFAVVTDLERVIPCVAGARIVEQTGDDSARAEITVELDARSLTFAGTVEIVERDAAGHRAVVRVRAREAGGQGSANATVTLTLHAGGGTLHTSAEITGEAATVGEGVIAGVLDGLIKDFTGKLGAL
jgi:carbon monoxide dehydrogenase subunit G